MEICEVCGKPATIGICDMIQFDNYDTGCKDYKLDGYHFFCVEHERESRQTFGGVIWGGKVAPTMLGHIA